MGISQTFKVQVILFYLFIYLFICFSEKALYFTLIFKNDNVNVTI